MLHRVCITRFSRFPLVLAFLVVSPMWAEAQQVAAGSASGLAGATVNVDVTFTTGGKNVGILQFDLMLPGSLTLLRADPCTSEPSKTLQVSGTSFVLWGGLAVIPSGCVARLQLKIGSGATGTLPVGIGNVVAGDPSGNPVPTSSVGGAVTVNTPADLTPPVISAVSASAVTNSTATIKWTTNEASNARVEYGTTTAYGASTALNTNLVTAHTQALTGLTSSKLYHYRVKSCDAAGNLVTSADFTFATLAAADNTPPVISSVSVASITSTTALISWSTSENADTQVEYGLASAYGSATARNTTATTAHTAVLTGLKAGSTYHFRAKSSDPAGNLAVSGDLTFTTASQQDTAPPVITGVSTTPVANSAAVRWSTNEPADSQLEYGTGTSYGSVTALDATLVTSHSQSVTGLAPSTTYHFRVKSKDSDGNLAISGDFTFKTTEDKSDGDAPKISNVTVTAIASTSATISWSIDEPADAQVEFGETQLYGTRTRLNPQLATQHAETVTGLQPKTSYHVRVISRDAAGNEAVSDDHTFTTAQQTEETKLTLSYPRLTSRRPGSAQMGESDYVGVAIANLDTQPATLTFTAYDALGRQIDLPGLTNPVVRMLKPAEQLPVVDEQLFGDVIGANGPMGWIKVESTSTKVAGFFLMFNSEMTVLDGANISGSPTNSFVFPEVEGSGFTRLNIANPNPDPVQLQFDLVRSDGSTRATASRIVNANGALIADITEVFADSAATASDYVRVRGVSGVLPFELVGKDGQYVEGLNGQPTLRGSQTLYSPQYAIGGPWRSSLSIVNLDSSPGTVTFRFIRDDASQIGATKVLPISGYGKIYIDDPGFFQSLFVNPSNVVTQGYIEIMSNGVKLAGSVVFGDPEHKQFSSALPLVSQLQTSLTFSHVSSNDHYFTGIAMLNPGVADTFATVELYGPNGTREDSATISLRARQRKSILLTELFPGLIGQNRTSGYVKVTSDKEIAAFAVFGAHDLSVLSAIPPQ